MQASKAKRARAAPPPATAAATAALLSRDKTGTHSARVPSHIDALAPDHAATVMHRRLHVSLDRIKKLVGSTVDARASVAKASHTVGMRFRASLRFHPHLRPCLRDFAEFVGLCVSSADFCADVLSVVQVIRVQHTVVMDGLSSDHPHLVA